MPTIMMIVHRLVSTKLMMQYVLELPKWLYRPMFCVTSS